MQDLVTVAELAVDLDPGQSDVGVAPAPPIFLDLAGTDWELADRLTARLHALGTVVVGVSTEPLPDAALPLLSALTVTLAPSGPGRTWVTSREGDVEAIGDLVGSSPYAAAALVSALRLNADLPVERGLVAESLTYAMLQGSREYRDWRRRTPRREVPPVSEPVRTERIDDVLLVALNVPRRHNAFGSAMRDGLIEALELAELDRSIRLMQVRGVGPSFCSGGDLDEFGFPDPAQAHSLRLSHSAALAMHSLRDRVVITVHGACIGAGIEVASFAARIEAKEGAWFQLPELGMGLIPGAGGTVSITKRIGRWRTAYMALTGRRIDLDTALDWGLVDARGEADPHHVPA